MRFPNPVTFVGAMMASLVYWLKYGRLLAPPDVTGARTAVCKRCQYFDSGQCQVCTCLVVAKVALAAERCPIGQWGQVAPPKWKRLWRLIH